jgi:hypothetical protein
MAQLSLFDDYNPPLRKKRQRQQRNRKQPNQISLFQNIDNMFPTSSGASPLSTTTPTSSVRPVRVKEFWEKFLAFWMNGNIVVLILTLFCLGIGALDFSTMMKAKPDYFSPLTAIIFSVIIGVTPLIFITNKFQAAIRFSVFFFIIDVILAGFTVDKTPREGWFGLQWSGATIIWIYFALQVGMSIWKLAVIMARKQGVQDLRFFAINDND